MSRFDKTDGSDGFAVEKMAMDKLKIAMKWLADHGSELLFPLCFIFANTLNLVFFYFGLAFQDNPAREYCFIGMNLLVALFSGAVWISVIYERKIRFSALIAAGAGVWLLMLGFLVSAIRFGITDILVNYFPIYVVFGVPSFFAGFCGAIQKKETSFYQTLENASFLAFPAALIYLLGQMFQAFPPEWGYNMGILNYMTIAYSFMPFLLAHLISFTRASSWNLRPGRPIKKSQLVRGIMIIIYWAAIIATGTRGCYVCVGSVCALLFLKHRGLHRGTWRQNWMPVLLMGLLFFNMFVYAPPGLSRVHRVNIFLDGVQQGMITTSDNKYTPDDELIDKLVQGDILPGDSGEAEAEMKYALNDRGALYKIAIQEIRKSPIGGMGPLGFSIKYGVYPHNAVLELFSETGVVGASIMLGIILLAIINLVKRSKRNETVLYLLIFIAAYALQASISGSIWECSALLWALGYGLTNDAS